MVMRRLRDMVTDILFWIWAFLVLVTESETWAPRLQVGALAAVGLVLLSAAPERAISVGAAFVALAIGVDHRQCHRRAVRRRVDTPVLRQRGGGIQDGPAGGQLDLRLPDRWGTGSPPMRRSG